MSHKISSREVGQGPPLILLHGYGGSPKHWEPVAENLESHYRVCLLNLSHLFLSQDRIFFRAQVEILAEYLRENFPRQKVTLAGTSYGGAIAWALAAQYPELVEKLILVNPLIADPVRRVRPAEIRYFCVLPWSPRALGLMLQTALGRAAIRRLVHAFRDERDRDTKRGEILKGKKLNFVTHLIHQFSWILRQEDWSYWLGKIARRDRRVPTQLIYDPQDYLFSEAHYQEFGALFACTEIKIITGAGHLAIKSRPDTISKMMLAFLQKNRRQNAG